MDFYPIESIKKKEHRRVTVQLEYHRYNIPLIYGAEQEISAYRYNESASKWIPIKSLLPRDMILMPIPKFYTDTKMLTIHKHNSPNPRYKDVPEQNQLSTKLLELFGRYLAEGCYSLKTGKGRFISLAGNINEWDVFEYFGSYIKEENLVLIHLSLNQLVVN
ncbi:hypothetical protein D0469_14600 [Peribacillus saganii]|uniref:Uncharacterized protein n=1 Tax=Peribacillus saganii TaxID=2303992 RepID=A0A372LLX8_9BACI|nr:hypothetical protein [Peribacillus saganii]RFU67481.1 hypothetical protein D0469_14600 [Peribacillus saganii]